MSAYVVDREHIAYLIEAALATIDGPRRYTKDFSWYHNGERRVLSPGDDERAAEVGQMLWDECVASVSYRYPDSDADDLPGETDDSPYRYDSHEGDGWCRARDFTPAQVFKACACYEYQSCEHPGWADSEARTFVKALAEDYQSSVDGYEDAAWGAPERRRRGFWPVEA